MSMFPFVANHFKKIFVHDIGGLVMFEILSCNSIRFLPYAIHTHMTLRFRHCANHASKTDQIFLIK